MKVEARVSTQIESGVPTRDAQPLAPARWDWSRARRVLVVRLRSIGDTVLATPTLHALKRFLPHAQVEILLEDWVAPVLEGSKDVDEIIRVAPHDLRDRLRVARELRKRRYDVVFNLHGGSTSSFLTRAINAKYRVGYASYRYKTFYNELAPPSSDLWRRAPTHSAEQQLALVGWTGVPVTDRPATRLFATADANASLDEKLNAAQNSRTHSGRFVDARGFALIHPAAAFETKRWAAENFARVIEHLQAAHDFASVIIAAPKERRIVDEVLNSVRAEFRPRVVSLNLNLPEVVALVARAKIFVGNDSGIAHIATAMRAPSVVIFGSSNVNHWRPWTPDDEKRAAIVREEMSCAPCPGYSCSQFDEPQCIRRVKVGSVISAIEELIARN